MREILSIGKLPSEICALSCMCARSDGVTPYENAAGQAPCAPEVSRKPRYADIGITGLMPSDWLCRAGA